MKRAAIALRSILLTIARGLGLEGAFLAVGTILAAVGASYVAPAGPWLVVGAMCIAAGLALAIPRRAE